MPQCSWGEADVNHIAAKFTVARSRFEQQVLFAANMGREAGWGQDDVAEY